MLQETVFQKNIKPSVCDFKSERFISFFYCFIVNYLSLRSITSFKRYLSPVLLPMASMNCWS